MILLGTPFRYAMIVLALLELVFEFAFVAGFLSPVRVTESAMPPRLQRLVGSHPAFGSKQAKDSVTTTKEIEADSR